MAMWYRGYAVTPRRSGAIPAPGAGKRSNAMNAKKHLMPVLATLAAAFLTVAAPARASVILQNAEWATASVRTNGMGAAHWGLPPDTTNFTIEAWVKPSASVGGNPYNCIFNVMGISDPRLLVILDGLTPKVFCNGKFYSSDASVPLGEWSHIAVVRSWQGYAFYVDGAQAGSSAFQGGDDPSAAIVTTVVPGIGCQRTGLHHVAAEVDPNNRVFQGSISDVRMWAVARTAEEIAANYAARLSGFEEGLALYVPFSDGEAGGCVVRNFAEGLALVVPPTQRLVEDASLDAKLSGAAMPTAASATLRSTGALMGAVVTDAKLNTAAYTIEGWARLDDAPANRVHYIMGQYAVGSQSWPSILFTADAPLTPKFRVGSAYVVSDTDIVTGRWFHVAATHEADGTSTLYLNGRCVGSAATNAGVPPSGAFFELFNTGAASQWGVGQNYAMAGSLREVRLWNYARSAGQIAAGVFRAATGAEEGLLGCFPLAAADSGRVIDKATGAECRMVRAQDNAWNTGLMWEPAHGLHSDGSGRGIATDVKITTSDFTMEAWMRVPRARGLQRNYVMGQWVSGNTTTWTSLFIQQGALTPVFNIGSATLLTSSTTVVPNQWFHLAATREGDVATLYMNGHVVASGTAPSTEPPPDSALRLFDVGNNDAFFGDLREVRVWGHARSQAQIVANMNAVATGCEEGLIGCWPLTEGPVSQYVVNRATGAYGTIGSGNGWCDVSLAPALAPMDEAAQLEPAPEFGGAWFGVARTRKGVDVGDFTFETWVRPTAWLCGEQWTPLFNQFAPGASPDLHDFVVGFHATDRFGVFLRDAGGWKTVDEPTPLGRWTHVAATRSGSTLRLYLDGELKKTVENYSTLSPWSETTRLELTLGSTDGAYLAETGRALHGAMREARVWGVARSGDEIRENMRRRLRGNEASLVGYWPLSVPDEADPSALADFARSRTTGYVLAGWTLAEPLAIKDPPEPFVIVLR